MNSATLEGMSGLAANHNGLTDQPEASVESTAGIAPVNDDPALENEAVAMGARAPKGVEAKTPS